MWVVPGILAGKIGSKPQQGKILSAISTRRQNRATDQPTQRIPPSPSTLRDPHRDTCPDGRNERKDDLKLAVLGDSTRDLEGKAFGRAKGIKALGNTGER